MRGLALTPSILFPALACAGPLGTRASAGEFDASPVGVGPVVQLLLALLIVGAGIRFALPAVVRRFGGRLSTEAGGTIRIEESASFPGGRLYVVEARGRVLLLGTTPQNVSMLADLTENDFSEALAGAAPDPFAQLARLEKLSG